MKLYIKRFECLKWTALVLMPWLLIACTGSDERPVYQGAEYYKNLEVPPDLTELDTGEQLRVPEPTEQAKQFFIDKNKLETVITPRFDGVRVVSFAGNSWLEVDNNVEKVWAELIKFWVSEGIELAEKQPSLGFMETEWIGRVDNESGFFRSMFQNFEPDEKDKFRIRFERFNNDAKTRLYLSHSRIERVIYGEEADQFDWVSQPSNAAAEREMIARMAVYAGLTGEQSSTLLENYRPYTSLVKIDSTNTTALTMSGSMEFVWRRAMRALDRMRVQNIREEKDENNIYFAVGKIANENIGVEKDELSESSWIMQWLTSTDEENLATNKSRQYRLAFSNVGGRIQIEVIDARQSEQTDEDGDVTGTALAEQIRDILARNLD
jgi:uncharacterized lipoprotein